MFEQWAQRVGSAIPRGFSRYYILKQLQKMPHTGKEIINSAVEDSDGKWKPSPGLIYPLLGRLLDEGLIEEAENGKYTISKKGEDTIGDLESFSKIVKNQLETIFRVSNIGKFMVMDVLERVTILGNLLSSNVTSMTNHEIEKYTKFLESELKKIKEIFAIVAVSPKAAGLEMKKPYIFEAMVSGGDIQKQFEHVKESLGKEIKIDQIFETGATVDVAAITKGHGWQGVMRRWNVKKKQHKSRKTVREVGSLGPISPQSIMYTVPRAGQTGFHQRVEYDKRIMVMGNADNDKLKINPDGGYKHFGLVKGDFIILKGSVPGTYRRLIKMRSQIRNAPPKVNKPNILEVVI